LFCIFFGWFVGWLGFFPHHDIVLISMCLNICLQILMLWTFHFVARSQRYQKRTYPPGGNTRCFHKYMKVYDIRHRTGVRSPWVRSPLFPFAKSLFAPWHFRLKSVCPWVPSS
jgi:hypothetical protein